MRRIELTPSQTKQFKDAFEHTRIDITDVYRIFGGNRRKRDVQLRENIDQNQTSILRGDTFAIEWLTHLLNIKLQDPE